jgi:ribosome-associated toxin RatA of RatAB toxin-antitoxin module
MSKNVFFAAVCAACLFTGLSASAQDAKLAKGEVVIKTTEVKGQDIPKVVAKAVIKAPMEKVWALIEKCENYEKTMLNIKSAKELSRKGNKVRCETVVDLPWPLSDLKSVTDANHTLNPGQSYVRAWTLVKGDFDYNNGSWKLTPFKGDASKTLLVYTVHVKPHTSVPDSIKASAQRKSLPDLFEHLRKQLE